MSRNKAEKSRRNNGKRAVTAKVADLEVNYEEPADQFLTTNQGVRVNDNQNTLKAGERGPFAAGLLRLVERLGEKYQVDELAARYAFTGAEPLTVPRAGSPPGSLSNENVTDEPSRM